MRILVFGSKGQLGRELLALYGEEATGVDLPDTDIGNAEAVYKQVAACKPSYIINAAAYTDVEQAENHPDAAFRANRDGARNVAEAARQHQAGLVHISTDMVFDGTAQTPYEPEAPVCPVNVYGQSKAAGEQAVLETYPDACIVRTAWLYGPGGNNFVEKILRAAMKHPVLKVVSDEVGSPTHTLDLAQAIQILCEQRCTGIFHMVNSGHCSRYVFALAILELAGVSVQAVPCTAAEYPSQAKRPPYGVLSTARLTARTGYTPRPWREALAHYLGRRQALHDGGSRIYY